MYPDGYCTNYEYDLCDRLVKVVGRASCITTYEYDENDNVIHCDRSNDTYTTHLQLQRTQRADIAWKLKRQWLFFVSFEVVLFI